MFEERAQRSIFESGLLVLMINVILSILWISIPWQACAKADVNRYKVPHALDSVTSESFVDNSFYGPLRKKYQIEDALISKLNYPPPVSQWVESEKELYKSLLSGQTYDVLVVPFQTKVNGIDLVGRTLMTYRLAVEIEQNTEMKVAPLRLVYPAIGRLARFYDEKEVLALARSLGVRRIIWGYAGTKDFNGPQDIGFSFDIIDQSVEVAGQEGGTAYKRWPYQPLGDETLPSKLFDDKIREVLSFLGIDQKSQTVFDASARGKRFPVPTSPADILKAKQFSRVHQSYILQMLAMLAPTEYHKKELFTRSLVSVFPLDKKDPDRRLIEARAYLHLYRRPAAVKALLGDKTGEGQAFLEYLNANLPETEKMVAELPDSIRKFLAQLELFDLRNEYKKEATDEEKRKFVTQYPEWAYFLKIYLSHESAWERASNVDLKLMMDALFPVPGFSVKDIAVGYNIVQTEELDNLQSELLFRKHIRLALAEVEGGAKNPKQTEVLGKDDVLVLFDAVGIFNLIQQIRFYSFTLDHPDMGLKVCDEVLRVYNGHPYFSIYKALVLNSSLRSRSAEEKVAVLQERNTLIYYSVWWNGCQNWVHRRARRYTWKFPEGNTYFINHQDLMHIIDSDYPFRTNIVSYNRRPEEMLVLWEHKHPGYHKNVYDRAWHDPRRGNNGSDKASMVLQDLKTRFNGSPKKTKILAEIEPIEENKHLSVNKRVKIDNSDHKKALYMSAVNAASKDWDTYTALAKLYIKESDYLSARQVMLRYPLFKTPEKFNTVEVSNKAGQAGDLLYWKGQDELCRSFFEISAGLDTGSGWSIQSEEYLALLDGDYQAAMGHALHRAKRYNSANGYTEYMKYLHMTGDHEKAWSLFYNLLGRYDLPYIWCSASVGHNIEGTTESQLIKWMDRMAILSPEEKTKGHLAEFGLWMLQEFAPSQGLIEAIEKVEVPPPGAVKKYLNHNTTVPGRSVVNDVKNQQPPKFHTSFANGYDLIKQKKYEAAFNIIDPLMDHYGWSYRNAGSTLKSYYVWAAVKSGNREKIERTVIRYYDNVRSPKGYNFDVELSYGAYNGGLGHHDKAVQHLKNAFAAEENEDRIYSTWNQLVEMCEWLYMDSGHNQYRELALEWSRAFQRIQPMRAWAYAVEANLAEKKEDKIRALAFAQYLSPLSKRISPDNNHLRQEAAEWMKKNNPFVKKSVPEKSDGV